MQGIVGIVLTGRCKAVHLEDAVYIGRGIDLPLLVAHPFLDAHAVGTIEITRLDGSGTAPFRLYPKADHAIGMIPGMMFFCVLPDQVAIGIKLAV